MKLIINRFQIDIDRRRVSRLIRYPDGIDRILTLTGDEWASVETASENGYKFEHVLWGAIELSRFRQSDSLPGQDIHSCTSFMLRTILGRILEERAPVANQNCPIAGLKARR